MQEMINDASKFEKVSVNPGKDYNFMKKQKTEVDNLLSELVDKRSISEAEREKLSPDGPMMPAYTVYQRYTNLPSMVYQSTVPSYLKLALQHIRSRSSISGSYNCLQRTNSP